MALAVLAACGGSPPSIDDPGAIPHRAALIAAKSDYALLYSFRGGADGAFPQAGLIVDERALRGTTAEGGSDYNDGTVFEVSPIGAERMTYSFKGYPADGQFPTANLTAEKSTIYGTTFNGGSGRCPPSVNGPGCGTVFKISSSGAESVLYSFTAYSTDGENPNAGVILVGGAVYGTTIVGGDRGCSRSSSGPSGCGTIFEISTSGKERVVHAFKGGSDGENPSASLTELGGKLYGTTPFGGNQLHSCEGSGGSGCGTVFELSSSKERVLYRFNGGSDGAHPFAGLLVFNGSVYGATEGGGTHGDGTLFEISTTGRERVLYRFKGGMDGAGPSANLTDLNGMLYGTTAVGGGSACGGYGCGIVFEMSTSGKERVLHRFEGSPTDGQGPHSLVAFKGALYGLTSQGGTNGDGSFFVVNPPAAPR